MYLRVTGFSSSTAGTAALRAQDAFVSPEVVLLAADASGGTSPHGEVASIMDSQQRTHIVWSDQSESGADTDTLMYAMVSPNGSVSTPAAIDVHHRVAAPSLIVDDSDAPHIVYFVKRSDGTTKTGNYGVYYATGPAGGSSFTSEQMSTNPTDPNDGSEGLYHCYVNDRPQIALDADGKVIVLYLAAGGSIASFERHVIVATKDGAWQHEQAFLPGNGDVTVSVDKAFEIPPRMTTANHVVWHDISDYDPRFNSGAIGSMTETVVAGEGSSFDVKHAQVELADSGDVHMFWWNDAENAWKATVLDGAAYGAIDTITASDTGAGNLFPATIDPADGTRYFAYLAGSSGPLYLVVATTDGVLEVPHENTGVFYGKRSLNVRDGFLSVVTNGGGQIAVTQGTVTLP